jgi:hypothetical protein
MYMRIIYSAENAPKLLRMYSCDKLHVLTIAGRLVCIPSCHLDSASCCDHMWEK